MQIETWNRESKFQEGIHSLSEGRLDEAEESLKATAASVLAFLGLVAFRRGEYGKALKRAKDARREAPDDPLGYLVSAFSFEAMNDQKRAAWWAHKALDIQFNLYEAHKLLARLSMPGPPYYEMLQQIHRQLNPVNYLEIGVASGDSICFASPNTKAIGIDPSPNIRMPLGCNVRIYKTTSDEYFASDSISSDLEDNPIELAFIDGMHLFEFALRDFINIEKHGSGKTVVLIHDCYPLDEITSLRGRITNFWTGDVWKIIMCLKKYRPDLNINVVKASPAGLGIVTGIDPSSMVLRDNIDSIIEEFEDLDLTTVELGKDRNLNAVENSWDIVRELIDRRCSQ